jgi:hypothetical protein
MPMFKVDNDTVMALFDAQLKKVRGRLRLDVSPSFRAASLRPALDPAVATSAVGERVLQLMGGLAEDAALVAKPPPYIVVMPSNSRLSSIVIPPLVTTFGLDTDNQRGLDQALEHLARDLFKWAKDDSSADKEYGVFIGRPLEVCMRCEPFPANTSQSAPTAIVEPYEFKPRRKL